MNKKYLPVVVLVLLIAAGVAFGMYWRNQAETESNNNASRNVNTTDTFEGEAVEYNPSYGSICPLHVRFVQRLGAPSVDCQCPNGYELDQKRVGGESCYDGAECPIFEVECVFIEQ
jgi:hypothetical protein